MHLLYVVEFDVAHEAGSAPAFDAVLKHVAGWLSRGSTETVTEADLVRPGAVTLPPTGSSSPSDVERQASWECLDSSDVRARRISVVHPLDSGVDLTTRVTVSNLAGRVALRIGMSREYPTGALTPVRSTPVYQPGVVRDVAEDTSLLLTLAGQRIQPQFRMVRDPEEVRELANHLRSSRRLPVALVHMRSLAGRDAAYIASRKLLGLTDVVTLNHSSRRSLELAIPEMTIPFGGARLVWSDLTASGPTVPSEQIEGSGREILRDALMPLLAPASALARGIDAGWRQARQAQQSAARSDAEQRLLSAREADDLSAERDALREKVHLLEVDLEEMESLAQVYADQVKDLTELARKAEDLRTERDYWKDQWLGRFAPEPEAEVDPWDRVPGLTPANDPSDTFLALTDASEFRIVFSNAAERSWSKISYPHPADMTAALVSLARAAHALYGDQEITVGHIDDWFKTSFGLNVATSDDTIEKNKSLRYFDYDGQRFDQTPHVKVRDAVKPNEVGRIHFAFDKESGRLIVNHVALKLYGI